MSERVQQSLPMPVISDHCPPHVPGYEWDCQCARCGSSCDYQDCDNGCDDGVFWDDYYDDDDGDSYTCDVCHGKGGWHCCLSSSNYCEANPLEGRADVPRGKIEWFAVREQP